MSFEEIRAEVRAGVAEAGRETSGAALVATITRPGDPDESTFPPTKGTPTDFTCIALIGGYSERDRAGSAAITDRDVRLTLTAPLVNSAGGETEPRNGDTIALSDGRTLHVQTVDPVQPGGVALKWACRARAGE